MKTARIAWAGAVHTAVPHADGLQLPDGSVLASTSAEEPLAFLKTASSAIGHRGRTPRPVDAKFMHCECELAVVIGRRARRVKAADALAHGAAYPVANDYAVRHAWLANKIAPWDEQLNLGDVVLAGSFTRLTPAVAGDSFHVDDGPLGAASFRFA
jgi:2-keto-4-pentenoate hydratase